MCGCDIEAADGAQVAVCNNCGISQKLPKAVFENVTPVLLLDEDATVAVTVGVDTKETQEVTLPVCISETPTQIYTQDEATLPVTVVNHVVDNHSAPQQEVVVEQQPKNFYYTDEDATLAATIASYRNFNFEQSYNDERESIYARAVMLMGKNDVQSYTTANNLFATIKGYKDADRLSAVCTKKSIDIRNDVAYRKAVYLMQKKTKKSLKDAERFFAQLQDYLDSEEKREQCKAMLEEKDYKKNYFAFFVCVVIVIAVFFFSIWVVQPLVIDSKINKAMNDGDYQEAMEYIINSKNLTKYQHDCRDCIRELRDELKCESVTDEIYFNEYEKESARVVMLPNGEVFIDHGAHKTDTKRNVIEMYMISDCSFVVLTEDGKVYEKDYLYGDYNELDLLGIIDLKADNFGDVVAVGYDGEQYYIEDYLYVRYDGY